MYDRQTHLAMAHCLRLCKENLAHGDETDVLVPGLAVKPRYVCAAIDLTFGLVEKDIRRLLKSWIQRQLGNTRRTLTQWLREEHKLVVKDEFTTTFDARKLQATRHAWVDHMIATLEAE